MEDHGGFVRRKSMSKSGGTGKSSRGVLGSCVRLARRAQVRAIACQPRSGIRYGGRVI